MGADIEEPGRARPRRFMLRGGELWRDPWDDYRWLRDNEPVHRGVDPHFGEYVVLSQFEHVFDAVRDTATYSSALGLTLDPEVMQMFDGRAAPIVMMDPPDHTAMRRLVAAPMTPSRVAAFEQDVTAFVDNCLDKVAATDDLDIIEILLKPLPSFVVAHYLGVPTNDRAQFDRWTDAIVAANAASEFASATAAFSSMFSYAHDLIARRRAEPGEDLVSQLVTDGSVDDQWIVGFVFTMVTGGNDTTTGLLGGALELINANPAQRQILLERPAAIRPAVDEFLRLTTPVQNLARTATRDLVVAGEPITKGQKVMLLYASANRDEREFGPTASQLDVTRRPQRTVAFAYGAHHCLGAAVARLAAGVALERLLARFPNYTVDSARGRFAPGAFVRRYESLPFAARG